MSELIKHHLMTPGPTDVPAEVLMAGATTQIHHRTPQFRAIYAEVCELMRQVFKTTRPVYPLCASGSGAMECAVANLTTPGSRPLVVNGGWFGKRWVDICRAYGMTPDVLDVEWGVAVDPNIVAARLAANPGCPAVFVQLSETSTGGVHPVRELQAIAKAAGALLVVDGISGVGAVLCETDAWELDCVITGSQKALMAPPGLAFISVGERCRPVIEGPGHPRFYWDLKRYQARYDTHDHAFTPPTAMLNMQLAALRLIQHEGVDVMIARHARLGEATRVAVRSLGLRLFAHDPGNVCTAVWMPEERDSDKLVTLLRDHYGIGIAGSQGPYKGKFFRIGHLGHVDDNDVIMVIGALERALNEMGFSVPLGAGIAAAQQSLVAARKEKQ